MFYALCHLYICTSCTIFIINNNNNNNGTALVVVDIQKFHVNNWCQTFGILTLSYNPAFRTRHYTEEG